MTFFSDNLVREEEYIGASKRFRSVSAPGAALSIMADQFISRYWGIVSYEVVVEGNDTSNDVVIQLLDDTVILWSDVIGIYSAPGTAARHYFGNPLRTRQFGIPPAMIGTLKLVTLSGGGPGVLLHGNLNAITTAG